MHSENGQGSFTSTVGRGRINYSPFLPSLIFLAMMFLTWKRRYRQSIIIFSRNLEVTDFKISSLAKTMVRPSKNMNKITCAMWSHVGRPT